MSHISLFGLNIKNITLNDASIKVVHDAQLGAPSKIYFINAHCINVASVNESYLRVLQDKNVLLFADGSGMRLASKMAGSFLKDNVNGTDLFPLICRDAAASRVRLALLGARPGIAQRCADNLNSQFPNLEIVWINDGYFNVNNEAEIIQSLNESRAQILFVAMGVPMQELWIARNASKLRVPVLIGVGALFDFYSGGMPRAPQRMREFGLEWLFRFLMEPRRMFVRYIIGNPLFVGRVLWRRLRGIRFLQDAPLIGHMRPRLRSHD